MSRAISTAWARSICFGKLVAIVDSRAVRRWAGHCLAAWLLSAPQLQAQPGAASQPVEAVIEIERAPGSQVCPDKEAVFRSIERLFPEREVRQSSDASLGTARARVTIRPLSPGHEAVLTLLPPRRGERVIREPDNDCRGLADALALAFVLLVAPPDSQTQSETAGHGSGPAAAAAITPEASVATPSKPVESPKSVREPEPTRPAAGSYQGGIGASIVGGLGVLSEPALGAAGELELFHRSGWGLSLSGLRLWSLPAEAEGGSVTLTLWGLLVAPCYRQRLARASRLDTCLRFGIGSQYAEVEGFQSPESGHFPWQVLAPSISFRQGFSGASELLSGFARVGFVGQLRPQSFSVRSADGSGDPVQIASAPKFGVMMDLGLFFGSGFF